MTLVLTELSSEGIAMASDSAITFMNNDGTIRIDSKGWKKIVEVPKITAAVSYWGFVGKITKMEFDRWLKGIIDQETAYADLPTFADYLANALNTQAGNKPLADGAELGIHVAGFHSWLDGKQRPFFFHIHNGHARYETEVTKKDNQLIRVLPKKVTDPRKLFQKHQDFPMEDRSLEDNLAMLERGYITRNGDFYIYSVIAKHLEFARYFINHIPGTLIPRDPTSLKSRKGYLHIMVKLIIEFYRCSNQARIIGGDVSSLAIGPRGYVR